MVLLSFLMNHKKLEIVAGVEDQKVVYQAISCCFLQSFLREGEKRFRNNMVSSQRAYVTFD